eukprot:CAMPEP_0202481242 /NCGR_PEP_ID=MMETSP1361-20130828/901_1 /ASSEMBLY_ACC=CAM_ASM_000849 /TAXON_ID=210615 /ORGANISM="Staurosira complex sp., Strain CCMP2646" /LENGTH=401 /DNA_ID=CAMNT_0049108741 /DNA_START=786 /DNA_END=1991 /DNA_ORIENTATION=-
MADQEPVTVTNRNERVLSGFASLLSSVMTTSGEAPEALSTSSVNLPRFVASTVPKDNDCCTVPCLMLKHSGSSSTQSVSLEETAARCLARPLTVTCLELEALPQTLLENTAETFLSLVDSRLRSSLSAILVQSDSQNKSATTRIVVGLLVAQSDIGNNGSPITATAVVTSFRILPGCDITQNGDHVAPLVMETVIDLNILRQLVTITFVAPGTIQGSFNSSSNCLLTNVEVVLDTVALLQSMMKQARSVVREAIVIASGVASNLLASPPKHLAGRLSTEASDARRQALSYTKESSTTDNDQGSSSVPITVQVDDDGASHMQPLLPQLMQSSGGSTPDLPSEDTRPESSEQDLMNAQWGQHSRCGGLTLLTAAASGLKQTPKGLQHFESSHSRHDTQPHKVS